MESEVERRFVELRAEGRRITGRAMPYGTEARIAGLFRERVEPGAFGDVGGLDVLLNVQHDRARPLARTGGGGLTFADDATALELVAELPATREADDALELVRRRVLRGLSIEFVARQERLAPGGVRVIERAELRGVALVDKPAYTGATLAVRHRIENGNMAEKPPKTPQGRDSGDPTRTTPKTARIEQAARAMLL